MWTRRELKTRAKRAVFHNFWAAVAVCFLLAFIGAEFTDSVEFIHTSEDNTSNYEVVINAVSGVWELVPTGNGAPTPVENGFAMLFNSFTAGQSWIFKLFSGGLFVAASLLLLLFTFLVCQPVMVGARHFFIHNRVEKATVFELLEVFHRDRFLNVVVIMLLKWIYTGLWTLLFIVPGMVKAYEYFMVPYLLADNPRLDHRRAFELSREMMRGEKWRAFILQISFVLWALLSSLTLGLAGIFFVNPYIACTHTELYATLKRKAFDGGLSGPGELPMRLD